MKNGHTVICMALWLSMVIGLPGCLSWEKGWEKVSGAPGRGDVAGLIDKAHAQIATADTREKVEALLGTYEDILKIDPWNYEALWSLGRYYNLMAVGYSDSTKKEKEYLLKALRYCERGMYTNPDFRKLADAGTPVWDACSTLSRREIEAMYYWYGAIGNYYRDCMNPIVKAFNIQWGGRNKKMVDCMMAIDPAWGGGHPLSALAVYYAFLPSFMGGDLKKAAEYFDKADAAGQRWLYVRYFRAIFLHHRTGDREAYRKDLEWVAAQDPHTALSPFPWNVYFRREAGKLLSELSR